MNIIIAQNPNGGWTVTANDRTEQFGDESSAFAYAKNLAASLEASQPPDTYDLVKQLNEVCTNAALRGINSTVVYAAVAAHYQMAQTYYTKQCCRMIEASEKISEQKGEL